MPHFSIEYSANLDAKVDFRVLCKKISETILSTGLFEVGALRVRAFRAEAYMVADDLKENGFIDMSFRIGIGRSAEEKKKTGEAIFKTVTDYLAPLFATPHFALTLEIREIDADMSWKKNAIHPRLRGR